jgi:hypothetical protein
MVVLNIFFLLFFVILIIFAIRPRLISIFKSFKNENKIYRFDIILLIIIVLITLFVYDKFLYDLIIKIKNELNV